MVCRLYFFCVLELLYLDIFIIYFYGDEWVFYLMKYFRIFIYYVRDSLKGIVEIVYI